MLLYVSYQYAERWPKSAACTAHYKWLTILPAASWHVFTSSTAALVACFEEAWSLRTATCLKEGATIDVAIATMCSASLRSSPAVIHKNLSRELTSYQSTNQSYVLPFIKDLVSWHVILAFYFVKLSFGILGADILGNYDHEYYPTIGFDRSYINWIKWRSLYQWLPCLGW